MLPPHELKTKKFTTVFRGYSPEEVNDQIAFLIEQYTELYKENDELERKLRMALAQLDSYKSDEESIRSALVNAQKAGARILRDANDRADTLMQATKATCEGMVSESAVAIRKQYAVLTQLREQSRVLREALISQYTAQFELIRATVQSEQEAGCEIIADEELVHSIIAGIKDEAVRRSERKGGEDGIPLAPDVEAGEEKTPAKPQRKPRSGTIWNKETVQNAAPSPAPRKIPKPEEPTEPLPAIPERVEIPAPDEIAPAETAPIDPAPAPIEPAPVDPDTVPVTEGGAEEATVPSDPAALPEPEAPAEETDIEDPGVPGDTAEPDVSDHGSTVFPAEQNAD